MAYFPEYYLPGSNLAVKLHTKESDGNARIMTVTVQHAFTPFTHSQVLLVTTASEISCEHGLLPINARAILKIYDPRFFDSERHRPVHPHPWSAAAEAEAVRRRSIAPSHDLESSDPTDDPVWWEAHLWHESEEMARVEYASYTTLRPLQGTGIPRLYARGWLATPLPDRAITPRALLIEHIPDAPSLHDVDLAQITPARIAAAVRLAHTFGALGVIHHDLNLHNILLAPDRVVIIDFGGAYVRDVRDPEDADDGGWRENVEMSGDVRQVELVFCLRLRLGSWPWREKLVANGYLDDAPLEPLYLPAVPHPVEWH